MTRLPLLLAGVLLFLVSLPLACRKVPMNRYYGVRTPLAYKSEKNWYDINAYSGRQLAIWSLVIVAVGVAGLFVPRRSLRQYDFWAVLATILAVMVALIRTLLWCRKYGS